MACQLSEAWISNKKIINYWFNKKNILKKSKNWNITNYK